MAPPSSSVDDDGNTRPRENESSEEAADTKPPDRRKAADADIESPSGGVAAASSIITRRKRPAAEEVTETDATVAAALAKRRSATAADAGSTDVDTTAKIQDYLRSRTIGARYAKGSIVPSRPTTVNFLERQERRQAAPQRKDLCPPARRERKTKKASSPEFDEVSVQIILPDNADFAAEKKKARDRDEGLPPELKRCKNGDTPFGRIRSCMCRNPSVCRELMWRWARLKEEKYVNYLYLPHSFKESTHVGRHIAAYRAAALRHLGYNIDAGEQINRTITHRGKEMTTNSMNKEERIAMVHFHPDVIPYILHERANRGNKTNKWRIPIGLGKKLGLKKEDKCPTRDSNDEQSFYILPNYDLGEATADVERAEMAYKQASKAMNDINEEMTNGMASNPHKYAMEIHDLKKQNANLVKEKEELIEKLKKERWTQSSMEKKISRLQKGLEKMTRKMEKWESTNKVRRKPHCSAKGIYKDATGQDLAPEEEKPSDDKQRTKGKGGQGGRRWSDPRMDDATEAKWRNPTLSSLEALRIGGYEFPSLDQKGLSQKDVMDLDNVSLAQRKNNLLRRLRMRKSMEGNLGDGIHAEANTEENETSEEVDEDLEMATVDDFV